MPDFLHHTYDLNQPEMASAFDQVSFWSARFGLFLFKYLELRPNLNILDLACGAGFPLFELVQVYGASCHVTGIDSWKEAVERARSKLQIYQFPNVTILEADAAHLPFQEPFIAGDVLRANEEPQWHSGQAETPDRRLSRSSHYR